MNVDPKHLLIPIHIDALVIGEDDLAGHTFPLKNGIVSAAPDYASLKSFYPSGADLRQPRKQMDPPLEPGVHLHFRLPAAVAHGELDKKPAFPRVPNRWLVQRYSIEGDVSAKAWLVFSDEEDKDPPTAVTVLVSPPPPGTPGHFYCRPTGVTRVLWENDAVAGNYDLSRDNQRAEVELTAVTGGDPGFSAHYPACHSILGLYDDLDCVPTGPNVKLAYVVTGWYSSTEDDPWSNFVSTLAKLKGDEKRKKIDQWMEERGCVRHFGDHELPDRILCHGCVRGVNRQADGSAPAQSDPFINFEKLENYWLDLGNTSAEAFASRVALERATQDPADRNLLEDLVTALQIGLFSQGSDPAQMDAELHRQGFTAVAGGKVWVIQQTRPGPAENAPTFLPRLPAELQKQLDALNDLQSKCDRHQRLFDDYRRELYALWHRWTAAAERHDSKTQAQLSPNLKTLQDFVKTYRANLDKIRTTRDGARQQLGSECDKHSLPPSSVAYSLGEEPIQPFYAPKDPVLLLTGPATQASGTKLRPATVAVRITGEELQSFTYDQGLKQNLTWPEPNDDWLEARGVSSAYLHAIPPWSARLFKEALLLDEMNQYPKAKDKAGVRPDPISRFSWPHNPWIPLYLYWEVSWQPDDVGDEIAPDTLESHWNLKFEGKEPAPSLYRRNTDLIPHGSRHQQTKPEQCHGLCFVGPPLFNLQYTKAEAQKKLHLLQKQIDESMGSRWRVMISQALGGLHDALTMRQAGYQPPPVNFAKWFDDDERPLYLDDISQILGADFHPESAPVALGRTSSFCPLRTGLLQLSDLWIIDAFGQSTRVWPETLSGDPKKLPGLGQSGRFQAGPPDKTFPPALHLYPRFCRPMRLEFEPSSTAADPICGWVVLNRFDQNLVLYAAGGRPAGILQRRFFSRNGTQFYWVPIPGASGEEAPVNGIQDPYLRDFANFVLSLDFAAGARLAELLNQAVEATEQRVPEDNPLLSVLVGRPLALVRAELWLEAEGLPALDQKLSWTADPAGSPSLLEILEGSLRNETAPPPNRFMKTGGVEKVRWPVRLGDRRSSNDGLVGFFKGEPPALREPSNLDSCPFYASWGFDFGNVTHAGLQPAQDLELDGETKLRVTLLMDPQARVHVTSGFLPKGALELSAAQLEGAKQVREVFFQAAPVLGTPTTPYVPKPSDDYGQWSWAYRPSVTGWAEDPNMVSAAELAGPAVGWPTLTEGWLKLKIEPVVIRSLWMKAPGQKPKKSTNVTLAWSVHGADSIAVFRLRSDGTEEPTPEKEWSAHPLVEEFTTLVTESTMFRVRASNRAGDGHHRDIAIQIEE
jgi:uncharacterized protein YukE